MLRNKNGKYFMKVSKGLWLLREILTSRLEEHSHCGAPLPEREKRFSW